MLNKMGGEDLRGGDAGAAHRGRRPPSAACEHRVIPDRIEAGTFVIAARHHRRNPGRVRRQCEPPAGGHRPPRGGRREDFHPRARHDPRDGARARSAQGRRDDDPAVPRVPHRHPVPSSVLPCIADGNSVITERIFPDRFLHVGELNRMGARIRKDGPTAVIQGVEQLSGATVMCSDLRAKRKRWCSPGWPRRGPQSSTGCITYRPGATRKLSRSWRRSGRKLKELRADNLFSRPRNFDPLRERGPGASMGGLGVKFGRIPLRNGQNEGSVRGGSRET